MSKYGLVMVSAMVPSNRFLRFIFILSTIMKFYIA